MVAVININFCSVMRAACASQEAGLRSDTSTSSNVSTPRSLRVLPDARKQNGCCLFAHRRAARGAQSIHQLPHVLQPGHHLSGAGARRRRPLRAARRGPQPADEKLHVVVPADADVVREEPPGCPGWVEHHESGEEARAGGEARLRERAAGDGGLAVLRHVRLGAGEGAGAALEGAGGEEPAPEALLQPQQREGDDGGVGVRPLGAAARGEGAAEGVGETRCAGFVLGSGGAARRPVVLELGGPRARPAICSAGMKTSGSPGCSRRACGAWRTRLGCRGREA